MLTKREFLLFVAPIAGVRAGGEVDSGEWATPRRHLFGTPPPIQSSPVAPPSVGPSRRLVATALQQLSQLLLELAAIVAPRGQ